MKLKSGFGGVDGRAAFELLLDMNKESGLDDGFCLRRAFARRLQPRTW